MSEPLRDANSKHDDLSSRYFNNVHRSNDNSPVGAEVRFYALKHTRCRFCGTTLRSAFLNSSLARSLARPMQKRTNKLSGFLVHARSMQLGFPTGMTMKEKGRHTLR